ncbi:unnamed protein product, partial [Tuber aestivum]
MLNGAPWPYLNVEPCKCRFRLLDGSPDRSCKITVGRSNRNGVAMVLSESVVPSLIYSNQQHPNKLTMILGIAERYEVIMGFSFYAGQKPYNEERLQLFLQRGLRRGQPCHGNQCRRHGWQHYLQRTRSQF